MKWVTQTLMNQKGSANREKLSILLPHLWLIIGKSTRLLGVKEPKHVSDVAGCTII